MCQAMRRRAGRSAEVGGTSLRIGHQRREIFFTADRSSVLNSFAYRNPRPSDRTCSMLIQQINFNWFGHQSWLAVPAPAALLRNGHLLAGHMFLD